MLVALRTLFLSSWNSKAWWIVYRIVRYASSENLSYFGDFVLFLTLSG